MLKSCKEFIHNFLKEGRIMTASKRKILLLFLSSFVGVLLVHLASTLPFYVIISGEIAGNGTGGIPYASFLARAVRFAACSAGWSGGRGGILTAL